MFRNTIIVQNSPSLTKDETVRFHVIAMASRDQHCRRDLPSHRKVSRAISFLHLASAACRQLPGARYCLPFMKSRTQDPGTIPCRQANEFRLYPRTFLS
jgi:hypothetical protein